MRVSVKSSEPFESRMQKLQKYIFGEGGFSAYQKANCSGVSGAVAVFISICDGKKRAKVLRASSETLEQAWNGACAAATEYIRAGGYEPVWIKADITTAASMVSAEELNTDIQGNKNTSLDRTSFFRRGISFDDKYETAVLEAEINGAGLIDYSKKKQQHISLAPFAKYLSANGVQPPKALPEKLLVFDCASWFCDEGDNVYTLYSSGLNCGRRDIPFCDKQTALDVVSTSARYIAEQVEEDGRFVYGRMPINGTVMPRYSFTRHVSAAWGLLCANRIIKDDYITARADKAIKRALENIYYLPDKANTAYFVDEGEIKVGGCGIMVILLTEYMKQRGSDEYTAQVTALCNGILTLQEEDGSFDHTLSCPSLDRKEHASGVHYDGEAIFALSRAYGLTKDERFLDAAKKSAQHLISGDRKYSDDQWTAYAMNELTMHSPREEYFRFALENVQKNLNTIYKREATYHSNLEMLAASFELYCRAADSGIEAKQLDLPLFVKTIFHRAHYMLNGYAYPESAMYLSSPQTVAGAFFVRHRSFRMRIDDVQHFCSAYCGFYDICDRLEELRQKLGININESAEKAAPAPAAEQPKYKPVVEHGVERPDPKSLTNEQKFMWNLESAKRGFYIAERILSTDPSTHYLVMNRHFGDIMRQMRAAVLLKKLYSDEKLGGNINEKLRKMYKVKRVVVITFKAAAPLANLFNSIDDTIVLSQQDLYDIGMYAKSIICVHRNLHRDDYGMNCGYGWEPSAAKKRAAFKFTACYWDLNIPSDFPALREWTQSSIRFTEELKNQALEVLKSHNTTPERSVILCPYAQTSSIMPEEHLTEFVEFAKAKGFTVFTNVSPKEKELAGTVRLQVPVDIFATLSFIGCTIIGVQSGILDVLRSLRDDSPIFVIHYLLIGMDEQYAKGSGVDITKDYQIIENKIHFIVKKGEEAAFIERLKARFMYLVKGAERCEQYKAALPARVFSSTNLNDYIREAYNAEDTVLFLAVCDSADKYWNSFDKEYIGLKSDLSDVWRKSYIAVVDKGDRYVYEKMGKDYHEVIYEGSFEDSVPSELKPANYYYVSSHAMGKGKYTKCAVFINGRQYALCKRGLNIVVYSKKLGRVVDSVYTDLWGDPELKIRR